MPAVSPDVHGAGGDTGAGLPPAPQTAENPRTAGRWSAAGRAWARRLLRLGAWVGPAIVAVIAVAVISPMLSEPMRRLAWMIWPPQSYVFVDSPEVYTRERLINERLDEEAWLNQQMAAIDSHSGLVTRSDRQSLVTAAAVTTSPGAEAPAAPDLAPAASAAGESSGALAFDQTFKLKSAYRNLIRQRLIENKLDDRHDLYGNALYILKFDTTVVSTPAARQFAEISVKIQPPSGSIYTGEAFDLPSLENNATFHLIESTLGEWLRNIEYRINAQIDTLYAAFLDGKASRTEVARLREFLSASLGISLSAQPAAVVDKSALVEEQSPYGRLRSEVISSGADPTAFLWSFKAYFLTRALADALGSPFEDIALNRLSGSAGETAVHQISIPSLRELSTVTTTFSANASYAPRVNLDPAKLNIYAVSKTCLDAFREFVGTNLNASNSLTFGGEIDDEFLLMRIGDGVPPMAAELSGAALGRYREGVRRGNAWRVSDFTPIIAQTAAGVGAPSQPSAGEPARCLRDPEATGQVFAISLDYGVLNFARKIAGSGTYSYSVLPRESPVAVMTEILRTSLASGTSPAATVAAEAERRRNGIELRPTLTTFGSVAASDPDRGDQGEPIVGWIIDPSAARFGGASDYDLVPIAESTLAIVSAPAWWPEIRLEIGTRWLDGEGNAVGSSAGSSDTFVVKLPNRQELLDTLLIDDARRGPVITSFDCGGCETATPPVTCTPQVMIQGHRLWRNTAVTIGSEKAVRVEVMPNMEGLVASFAPSRSNRHGRLRVWTSQGVAELPEDQGLFFISPGAPCLGIAAE